MRNVTECQQKLIALKYLPKLNEKGEPNDDGKFGTVSLDAFNHYRASLGKPPIIPKVTMEQLNADLFPEDVPPAPPARTFSISPIVRVAISLVLNTLKGNGPMLTTFDKAWVSGVVAFVCQYVINHFFNITVSADTQSLLVTVIVALVTAAATWIVPNKPKT
jgi:hypothetical protein